MIATLNYIFNICILIGFTIPLLNLVSGWLGGLFSGGGGGDVDFDVDIDVPTDVSVDFTTDFSADIPTDFSADFSADISADFNADFSADVGADAGSGAGTGAGGTGGALIPFNIMCLCLSLVVFGATGHISKTFMASTLITILLLPVCLAIAGFAYVALYKLVILRLKNNDASATAYRDLRGKKAEVTLSIMADSVGTISLLDSTGAKISFRAKIDPDLKDKLPEKIPQGESVVITEVDTENKLCYVSMPFHKFK